MKIYVTGSRGIPAIPGGVEKHCEELYPRVVSLGHEVRISRRKQFVRNGEGTWKGVQLEDINCPSTRSLEAIVHTFISIFRAKIWGADIVHIHAIGPALFTPLARVLGMKVVVTTHGADYERAKWGVLAKFMLALGEKAACIWANTVIAISTGIHRAISPRANDTRLIPNGVRMPVKSSSTDYIAKLGLTEERYILAVGRFVPEKGFHDLVGAFNRIDTEYKLVLVGDSDHPDKYSNDLKNSASKDDRIIQTGYITGDSLNQIYSNADILVLPSYHEGLPFVLLEAMSYGLYPVVSNIDANLEVGLEPRHYFRVGEQDELKTLLESLLVKLQSEECKTDFSQLLKKYGWNDIAKKTVDVYSRTLFR